MALLLRWHLLRAIRSVPLWVGLVAVVAWIPLTLALSPGAVHALDAQALATRSWIEWTLPAAMAGGLLVLAWSQGAEPFSRRLEPAERWGGETLGLAVGTLLPALALGAGALLAGEGHQHGPAHLEPAESWGPWAAGIVHALWVSLSLTAAGALLLSLPLHGNLRLLGMGAWGWMFGPRNSNSFPSVEHLGEGLLFSLENLGGALILLGLSLWIRTYRDRVPSRGLIA